MLFGVEDIGMLESVDKTSFLLPYLPRISQIYVLKPYKLETLKIELKHKK